MWFESLNAAFLFALSVFVSHRPYIKVAFWQRGGGGGAVGCICCFLFPCNSTDLCKILTLFLRNIGGWALIQYFFLNYISSPTGICIPFTRELLLLLRAIASVRAHLATDYPSRTPQPADRTAPGIEPWYSRSTDRGAADWASLAVQVTLFRWLNYDATMKNRVNSLSVTRLIPLNCPSVSTLTWLIWVREVKLDSRLMNRTQPRRYDMRHKLLYETDHKKARKALKNNITLELLFCDWCCRFYRLL